MTLSCINTSACSNFQNSHSIYYFFVLLASNSFIMFRVVLECPFVININISQTCFLSQFSQTLAFPHKSADKSVCASARFFRTVWLFGTVPTKHTAAKFFLYCRRGEDCVHFRKNRHVGKLKFRPTCRLFLSTHNLCFCAGLLILLVLVMKVWQKFDFWHVFH